MLKNPETEQKIDALLAKMTLREKIGQLNQLGGSPVGGFGVTKEEAEGLYQAGNITKEQYDAICQGGTADANEDAVRRGEVGAFLSVQGREYTNRLQRIAVEESRLGIPLLFGLDVIHGHRTVFPSPIAEACTWNTDTFEESAHIAAREAREDGINWTFTPMLDIARDPRWGRIVESPGEDTYFATRYAVAKIKGFQGEDMSTSDRICACAKHFVAYGQGEGGRDYNTVDMSEAKLREVYLPPFEAAIEAGVGTIMPAFNDLSGIPCTSNKWLLDTYLRGEHHFEGFCISDAHAVKQVRFAGTARDEADAAVQSVSAGCDMDMGCEHYIHHLEGAVANGILSEEVINEAVRRVLRVKFALGLFEHPYVETPREPSVLSAPHRAAARDAARRSVVLLKNDGILPLSQKTNILVVGYFADRGDEMLGSWVISGQGEDSVTLLDALNSRGVDYTFVPCVGADMTVDFNLLDNALAAAEESIVLAMVGEKRDNVGEACSKGHLDLEGEQSEMLAHIHASGKSLVTLLFNGRPMTIGQEAEISNAVVETWQLGVEAGNATLDVLFGDYNPSGRLTVTFPRHVGQCPTYYNHPKIGRPYSALSKWTSKYIDDETAPLYPFGYGLSYTTYTYENLVLRVEDDILAVSVDVTNTGSVPGEETVQIYTQCRYGLRVRPVKELKGWDKVFLYAGETKTVTVRIARKTLGYYDAQCNFITEPNTYFVWAAHDSSSGVQGEIAF